MTLGHPVPFPVDVHVSRNRTCRREAAATWGQGAGHPKRLLPGCYCLAQHLCPLLLGPQPSACCLSVPSALCFLGACVAELCSASSFQEWARGAQKHAMDAPIRSACVSNGFKANCAQQDASNRSGSGHHGYCIGHVGDCGARRKTGRKMRVVLTALHLEACSPHSPHAQCKLSPAGIILRPQPLIYKDASIRTHSSMGTRLSGHILRWCYYLLISAFLSFAANLNCLLLLT